MSPKIAFIAATILSVVGIGASVAVPEVRCFFRLDGSQCPQVELKEVELIVQSESQNPLSDVNVVFKSKGAPETSITDSNGYAKIKIPETEVQVVLRKEGFETLTYSLDLHKDPSTTRTYRLKSIISSSVTSSQSPVIAPSSEPSTSPLSPTPSSPPVSISKKLEVECTNSGGSTAKHSQLISVGNKTEDPKQKFALTTSMPRSLVCKILENAGELKLAYALSDKSDLNRVGVNVYVDGNLRKSLKLSRGEALRETIDLTGASGYKLSFEVLSPRDNFYHSDSVYILDK